VIGESGHGLAAVDVLAEDDPARSPGVVLSYVTADLRVPAAEAEALAGLLRILGADGLAGHVEHAAALIREELTEGSHYEGLPDHRGGLPGRRGLVCRDADTRDRGHDPGVADLMDNRQRAAEMPWLIPHGTWQGRASWGCTCPRCRGAWAAYMRDYRQRRMAATGERVHHGRFVPR